MNYAQYSLDIFVPPFATYKDIQPFVSTSIPCEGYVTKVELYNAATSMEKCPTTAIVSSDTFEVIVHLSYHLMNKSFFNVCCNTVIMTPVDHNDVNLAPVSNSTEHLLMSDIVRFMDQECYTHLQEQVISLLGNATHPITSMSQYLVLKISEKAKISKLESSVHSLADPKPVG